MSERNRLATGTKNNFVEDTNQMGETKEVRQENEALIAEMVSKIESTTRDSVAKNPVIHRGDESQPAPMVMEIQDEGLVVVYETTTGEPVKILKYMIPQVIKLKNPDGTARFTGTKPPFEPRRGTLKCWLHPDGENRKHYDELGLPVCKKSNMTAPYMVEQHMKKRHPSAWAIIDKERIDKEKIEDKDFQRMMLREFAKAAKK